MPPRCILFDWDGTLHYASSFKFFVQNLVRFSCKGWLCERIFEILELIDYVIDRPRLFLSREELRALSECYIIGIVTNRSKMFLESMLHRARIPISTFGVIGAIRGLWNTWHDASLPWIQIETKPTPFWPLFHSFFEREGLFPQDVLYVGDDPVDYFAVKESGCRFAAIARNAAQRDAFREGGVSEKHIFSTIHDALAFFGVRFSCKKAPL
ncbi:MAG: HAD family hydrolase [Patescibacteria group bacterium]|nr:HAD family hydrolase [Patescibacteria group bacterium]MDE2438568.1 HAD family hydrolase [Patescibacteria group bacterium]